MIEFLIVLGLIALFGALLLGALKLLFSLLLLPFKLGLWMLKGLIGLVLFVPALLFAIWVFSCVFPFIVALVAIPILIVVAGIASLVRMF